MTDPQTASSPTVFNPPLTVQERVIVAGAGGTALLCFFPWWKVYVSAELEGLGKMMEAYANASGNAFTGWEGVLVFLLCVATAGIIPACRVSLVRLGKEQLALLPLAGSALALVLMLVFFGRVGRDSGPVSVGRTFWFYLALLAMGAVVWKAFERWRAANVPAPPAAA